METLEGVKRRSTGGGGTPHAPHKDYCRFCLIKFERRFMIPIFSPETKRLEQQIRSVLRTIEMTTEDQYSKCICIECAMKVSTAFNFTQFCHENQKLLRSSHFDVNLLVEATDDPHGHLPVAAVDLTHLEEAHTTTTATVTETQRQRRRRRSTPTNSPPDPEQQQQVQQPPQPVSAAAAEEADEEDVGMELPSSMLECQLDEEQEVEGGVEEEESPKEPAAVAAVNQEGTGGLPPSNPYRCSVCFREFGKKANVLSHFQTQHTNLEVPSAWKYEIEPAKCPLCGDLVECLFAHLEYHAQRRTFKCESCEWAFYSKNYLNIHTAKLHKADAAVDAKPDRFVCKLCPPQTVCRDYDDLVAHYRQWHLNEMKNKMETCPVCSRETRYLKQHMEKMHGGTNGGQNPFQCHLCSKSYGQARYLQTHFTTAHKEHSGLTVQAVHCQQQQQSQPMDYSQAQHSQPLLKAEKEKPAKRPRTTNPGGPVHCVKCQMQFPNNRMLNMHIQRYHNANVHSGSPPKAQTTAEVSVTAIPATAGPLNLIQQQLQQVAQGGAKKRRRDSVPEMTMSVGPPKDMWNNSALTGMLVNMFGGMHGHYED